MNITDERSGQADVDIMARDFCECVLNENTDKSVFKLYLVSPCKLSAPARATMEAAAGARAAAL